MQDTDGTGISRRLDAWARTLTLRSFVGTNRVAGLRHLAEATGRTAARRITRRGGAGRTPGSARIEEFTSSTRGPTSCGNAYARTTTSPDAAIQPG